jgi:aminoglycoside 6'-N-acetyltransferase I
MVVVHPILTADSQTEIGVRHIQPSDRERWLALRCQQWPDESEDQLAEDTVRYFAEPERRGGMMPEAVLVAVQLGEAADLVVGFAELSRRMYAEGCESSPVGFLEGWFVIPSLRGRGVGRALVKAGEEWARTVGCREFASDTTVDNVDSAAAHRALGFEEVEVIRCFRKDLE